MLVSDGMGGFKNGGKASYITAKRIKGWFENQSLSNLEYLDKDKIESILNTLIEKILNEISPHSGTTLNMSIIGPETTTIINIGDSRAYTIKGDQITLRTYDDSLAFKTFMPITSQERERLRFYKRNNIITKAISEKKKGRLEVITIKNEDYDILCHLTDGVSDILSENQIKSCLQEENSATSLVDTAISSGLINRPTNSPHFVEYIYPKDNATAIVYTRKRKKNN